MWKYKIWVRPSPIHIQGRQSPGWQLLAPNGTHGSPTGTPPGLELLSSCYRFAQVFLLNHLPHPPTQQTKALPYTFISRHAERAPFPQKNKSRRAIWCCLDLTCADIFQMYLLFAPVSLIPLLFPIVHCLLGTVPAKVFFFVFICSFFPGNFTMHE